MGTINAFSNHKFAVVQYANKIRSIVLGILAFQFNIALYLDNIRIGLQNVGIGILNWVIRFENCLAFGQYPFLTMSLLMSRRGGKQGWLSLMQGQNTNKERPYAAHRNVLHKVFNS